MRRILRRLKSEGTTLFRRATARATQPAAHLDLLVLDDVFPSLRSGFRVSEFNAYLRLLPNSAVVSTGDSIRLLDENASFESSLTDYARIYPELAGRVRRFASSAIHDAEAAYVVFLHNMYTFVDYVEKRRIRSVFTLYPGGGFLVDDERSDAMLTRVLSSRYLEKVIVTQKLTHSYLIDRGFCEPERIAFIYGGVFGGSSPKAPLQPTARRHFGADKPTLDLAFVAFKYGAQGAEKGFDTFVAVAEALAASRPWIRFHVVGNFTCDDADCSALGDSIQFYGPMASHELAAFFEDMDLIISPIRPFVQPGKFDGFPTGACIEAGLKGVAVACADPLGQNVAFRDGDDILIISDRACDVVQTLEPFVDNPDALYGLAARGARAFGRTFSFESQLAPRVRLFESLGAHVGCTTAFAAGGQSEPPTL
jgi:glycosyltransferase involved in cell wall biosynthesis